MSFEPEETDLMANQKSLIDSWTKDTNIGMSERKALKGERFALMGLNPEGKSLTEAEWKDESS
jgi:hypothetical protein